MFAPVWFSDLLYVFFLVLITNIAINLTKTPIENTATDIYEYVNSKPDGSCRNGVKSKGTNGTINVSRLARKLEWPINKHDVYPATTPITANSAGT